MTCTPQVVYDDPLGMLNPTFYCTRCFLLLHPSGQPPAPAQVFPYVLSANIGGPGEDAGGEEGDA